MSTDRRLVATPDGPAGVRLRLPPPPPATAQPSGAPAALAALAAPAAPDGPRALVILGHGAGGGIEAPDLTALADVLPRHGLAVALVEQPYRLRGRRAPVPAYRLDAAWTAAVDAVRRDPRLEGAPLVAGGRSSGARVACRTADATGAAAVLALAFPLRPPARPDRTRLHELRGLAIPVLAVQGSRDAFGSPDDLRAALDPRFTVHPVAGADHAFRSRRVDGRPTGSCVAEVVDVTLAWLDALFPRP